MHALHLGSRKVTNEHRPNFCSDFDDIAGEHTGWPKNLHIIVRFITSSDIDQFSNFFHYQKQRKIGNSTVSIIAKDPTAPQVCRYTTLYIVSVLKATTENKTTSAATHFKSASSSSKADTLNT